MNCPHCGKPDDGLAQVRVLGHRWHQACWLPWLKDRVADAEAEVIEERRRADYRHEQEFFFQG